jgi:hypothetical protein
MPSWQGFLYSVVDDPVLQRAIPPDLMLHGDLLRAAGGNPSGNSTSFPGKDDPWSLRLVPTYDTGVKNNSAREIDYKLVKLDGKSSPNGPWYLTEHQTLFCLADCATGMTHSDKQWLFQDLLGCITGAGCGPSHQTFTISPNMGDCASPSYGNVQNTKCNSSGSGYIVVHSPSSAFGDAGVLWLDVIVQNITVDGFYRWPGVSGPK